VLCKLSLTRFFGSFPISLFWAPVLPNKFVVALVDPSCFDGQEPFVDIFPTQRAITASQVLSNGLTNLRD
jgi:hypothetical protein